MADIWTKITVTVNTKDTETVCAVMSMLDNGLMIEDYSDFSLEGMYGALVDDSILHADRETARISLFVPPEKHPQEYLAYITERLAALHIAGEAACSTVQEEDWAQSWKQYYHPVPLGRVTIVPAWEEYTPGPGEVVVRMDPGMAFGTGTHETTRIILRMMADLLRGGERVLDIGTGSGILSIAAVKLGAASSNAYDIDPVAVRVAQENARREGCETVVCGVSDLLAGVDKSGGKYDFCVANIVADVILRMLPDMGEYLKEGAPLLLSGIIAPRAEEIRDALAKQGYDIFREETENDWIGFAARRRAQ